MRFGRKVYVFEAVVMRCGPCWNQMVANSREAISSVVLLVLEDAVARFEAEEEASNSSPEFWLVPLSTCVLPLRP